MLTSDEARFTLLRTEALTENAEEDIKTLCASACATLAEKPSLILAYAPLLPHFSGTAMVRGLDEASGGCPIFGALSSDHTPDFCEAQTLFNGEASHDRMVLVLVEGAPDPRFFMISVSEGNIQKQKGLITGSDVNVLKSVNDMPCVEYMASIGLNPNDGLEGSSSIPFMVDYHDGSPPAGRGVLTYTPEGWAICGGEMPLNATLAVGLLDSREITRASEKLFNALLEEKKDGCLLVISCIGRCLSLGLEPLAEMAAVRRVVGERLPLHMSYSGGEMCPVYIEDGTKVNRFHNFTLAVCLL